MALENYNKSRKNKNILRTLNNHKIDIIFAIFCLFLIHEYNYYISLMKVPIHDGAYYLLNAHDWLTNKPLDEFYRPPLISWIIAGIWSITGESWTIVKGLQAVFTISAGIILYILLRKHKGAMFAFSVTALTMVTGPLFFFSTQIGTEGLSLFFVILTLYFLKSRKESHWFLAGITIGLTFASRYPIILQPLVIFIVESLIAKKPKLAIRTISGMLLIIIIIVLVVYLKAGTFQTALAKDTTLTLLFSPFYLINSTNVWGLAFLLVPIALLHQRTYSDKFNYTFIAWFIVSLLFWSANSANFQFRFTIQYTPAVYFLSVLAIENIIKNGITINNTILFWRNSIFSLIKSFKHIYKYDILGRWEK
jgi:4-amino-4-deoxy-L-arabinose transferase-like glycosyltransferase